MCQLVVVHSKRSFEALLDPISTFLDLRHQLQPVLVCLFVCDSRQPGIANERVSRQSRVAVRRLATESQWRSSSISTIVTVCTATE
jgi:hypothetical protein